ncbi:MAG: glutamate-cysteine ligase family protein [Pirellulaceae bacterium]
MNHATNQPRRFELFEAFGIELEYMVVDRDTLDVRPVADEVLSLAAGKPTSDFQDGTITWSNELALHVLELKATDPVEDLIDLCNSLQKGVRNLHAHLASLNAVLLPSGMHPWMNPQSETRLWPHECAEIYNAYHEIFDCHTHGWSNVQSVHLNLPFANDGDFARLHAAVRILLPILPALTAGSPIMDQCRGTWLDMRMRAVRDHCCRVPFLTGQLIPEPFFDEATYRREIFDGLENAIEPFNASGVFDPNFLNARGAIARFDRGSIEVRVMDVQEHPAVDVAVCVAVIAALKTIVSERWQPLSLQKKMGTPTLSGLLDKVSATGERTVIDNPDFLRCFAIKDASITAGELWRHIISSAEDQEPMLGGVKSNLQTILKHGTLATRIVNAVGDDYRREHLQSVYQQLATCLVEARSFPPT